LIPLVVFCDNEIEVAFTEAAKLGVEMYCTAQDFAQVDKAFRRLVNHLYQINKVIGSRRPSATKPPVSFIWGLCAVRELDPSGYDEDKKKFASESPIPSFFFIRKHYCDIFNTTQEIAMSAFAPLRKIVRICPEDGYKQVRYV